MFPRTRVLIASLALAFGLGGVAAAQEELVTDVPFRFAAAGKIHEAGRYTLQAGAEGLTVTLTSPKGAREVEPVLTRLAAPEAPASEGRVVFDKMGDKYTLSEIWAPGEDGFLLNATKEKHTHHTLKLGKRARSSPGARPRARNGPEAPRMTVVVGPSPPTRRSAGASAATERARSTGTSPHPGRGSERLPGDGGDEIAGVYGVRIIRADEER